MKKALFVVLALITVLIAVSAVLSHLISQQSEKDKMAKVRAGKIKVSEIEKDVENGNKENMETAN